LYETKLEKVRFALEQTREQADMSVDLSSQENMKLQTRVQSLEKQHQALKESLRKTERENEKLQQRARIYQSQVIDAQNQVATVEEEAVMLQCNLEQEKERLAELSRQLKDEGTPREVVRRRTRRLSSRASSGRRLSFSQMNEVQHEAQRQVRVQLEAERLRESSPPPDADSAQSPTQHVIAAAMAVGTDDDVNVDPVTSESIDASQTSIAQHDAGELSPSAPATSTDDTSPPETGTTAADIDVEQQDGETDKLIPSAAGEGPRGSCCGTDTTCIIC
jgi:chromosome segregation ATPase